MALFGQFGLGLLWVVGCVFWALDWFLGILSCVLGGASCFLINTTLLIKKKKIFVDTFSCFATDFFLCFNFIFLNFIFVNILYLAQYVLECRTFIVLEMHI
jgi:hypothetical protein